LDPDDPAQKKETVHNPLEYLGLSHAALAEKHGGRSPAAYSINCCVVKIFQMFFAVCVNFFRNQRTDRPSAVFLFCEKLFGIERVAGVGG